MHIHLPKPLHGWREFVGEVVIIVIGVLIALGAEQVVENLHHRSQVREMIGKLHTEGLANRQVLQIDAAILRPALAQLDAAIAALNNCRAAPSAGLQPLSRPRFLQPENAAWMGLRDSALLPLMPHELAADYWKLDVAQSFLREDTVQANNAFMQASGALETVRRGGTDRQVCDEALISLGRLRQAQADLLQRTGYNSGFNEQLLHGERIHPPREDLQALRGERPDAVVRPAGLAIQTGTAP